MKKYTALISAPYLQAEFEDYKHIFDRESIECVLPNVIERLEENELLDLFEEYTFDGVICGDDAFTKNVLDHTKQLKVIVKWGTGIDSIDKTYALKIGIPVCNTPNAFTEPVSDTIIAFILDFARNVVVSDRLVKGGRWEKPKGFCLDEKVIGIIGIGNIGRAVARKLAGFGCKLLGNDIADIPGDVVDSLRIEMVAFPELLRRSDFVILACDLNPTSLFLIRREQLHEMKSTAFLINTARGPLVREDDLIRALHNGHIAGAALDVFESEPLSQDSPLLKMANVRLSAHSSNSSPKYWKRVHENSIRMLLNHMKGIGETNG